LCGFLGVKPPRMQGPTVPAHLPPTMPGSSHRCVGPGQHAAPGSGRQGLCGGAGSCRQAQSADVKAHTARWGDLSHQVQLPIVQDRGRAAGRALRGTRGPLLKERAAVCARRSQRGALPCPAPVPHRFAHPFFVGLSWIVRIVRSFLVLGAIAVEVKARDAAPAWRVSGQQAGSGLRQAGRRKARERQWMQAAAASNDLVTRRANPQLAGKVKQQGQPARRASARSNAQPRAARLCKSRQKAGGECSPVVWKASSVFML
jgi:hypothetical protein